MEEIVSSIELSNLKDQVFRLTEVLKEKRINIFVFYNTDCLGCIGRALPFAFELSKKYLFVNLVVVHVQFGRKDYSVQDIKSVFTDQSPPFEIYRDNENRLYDFWKGEGTPFWVILNGQNIKPLHSVFGSQEGAKMRLELAISEAQSDLY